RSHPKGVVHSETVRLLNRLGFDTSRLRSKAWDEFSGDSEISINHIVTVCNNGAGEVCPITPGKPAKTHWDIPDPATVQGGQAEIEAAFFMPHDMLSNRIRAFILPSRT